MLYLINVEMFIGYENSKSTKNICSVTLMNKNGVKEIWLIDDLIKLIEEKKACVRLYIGTFPRIIVKKDSNSKKYIMTEKTSLYSFYGEYDPIFSCDSINRKICSLVNNYNN